MIGAGGSLAAFDSALRGSVPATLASTAQQPWRSPPNTALAAGGWIPTLAGTVAATAAAAGVTPMSADTAVAQAKRLSRRLSYSSECPEEIGGTAAVQAQAATPGQPRVSFADFKSPPVVFRFSADGTVAETAGAPAFAAAPTSTHVLESAQ